MPSESNLVSVADRQAIAAAVSAAEQKTSAEICPAVASASGRYDRAEDMIGLWLSLLTLAILWFTWPPVAAAPDSWGGSSPVLHLLGYALAMIVAFIVGAMLASKFTVLRLLCTSRQEMTDEVRRRASGVFFDRRIHRTTGSTGILLFASLYERQALVLVDQQVLEAVGQATLDRWCREFTAALRTQSLAPAFSTTISQIGVELGSKLPRQAGDVNEIADALVVLE